MGVAVSGWYAWSLFTVRGADGQWRKSRKLVEDYRASRYEHRSATVCNH
jgi:hypothetical protein